MVQEMYGLLKKAGLIGSILLVFLSMTNCAGRRDHVPRFVSTSLDYPAYSELIRMNVDQLNEHPGQSGFHLLPNNTDALITRLLMAQSAERTLDVQYYDMHNDQSGWLFVYNLLKAADRGVRVRILLDDIYVGGRGLALGTIDLHPNIELRLFNPLAMRGPFRTVELVLGTSRLGRRMHNKAFIADNTVAVIGGRNIGDEYLGARAEHIFADLDVLTVGPAVDSVSRSFDAYWNSEWAVPVQEVISATPTQEDYQELKDFLSNEFADQPRYDRLVHTSELSRQWRQNSIPMEWATARVLYDLPKKIDTDLSDRSTHLSVEMGPILEQTQWEFLLISPYLIPSEDGLALFRRLRENGVRIRIATNSLASNDVPIVHSGYTPYREKLLEMGVEIYEFKPTASTVKPKRFSAWRKSARAGLHAKALILDRDKVFIGSTNLDPRSRNLNTEIAMMIQSPELAQQMIELFEEIAHPARSFQVKLNQKRSLVWTTEENGREITYDTEPEAGIWRRLGVTLAKPLPIEDLL